MQVSAIGGLFLRERVVKAGGHKFEDEQEMRVAGEVDFMYVRLLSALSARTITLRLCAVRPWNGQLAPERRVKADRSSGLGGFSQEESGRR
jgi:hypothetical protein